MRALTTTAAFACVVLAACARDTRSPEDAAQSARGVPTHAVQLDSAAVRAAELALRHFLDASREGSTTRGELAALTNCGDDVGNSYFPTMLLAGYSVLASDMRGDTVIGHASVVTVAEQDIDRRGSGFVARQRVREDVLEWDVIPTENDQWVVCNGLRFGYLGADSLTTWRPEGSSYQTVRGLVDSIRKARHN